MGLVAGLKCGCKLHACLPDVAADMHVTGKGWRLHLYTEDARNPVCTQPLACSLMISCCCSQQQFVSFLASMATARLDERLTFQSPSLMPRVSTRKSGLAPASNLQWAGSYMIMQVTGRHRPACNGRHGLTLPGPPSWHSVDRAGAAQTSPGARRKIVAPRRTEWTCARCCTRPELEREEP